MAAILTDDLGNILTDEGGVQLTDEESGGGGGGGGGSPPSNARYVVFNMCLALLAVLPLF